MRVGPEVEVSGNIPGDASAVSPLHRTQKRFKARCLDSEKYSLLFSTLRVQSSQALASPCLRTWVPEA